jgi:hypothetical protein
MFVQGAIAGPSCLRTGGSYAFGLLLRAEAPRAGMGGRLLGGCRLAHDLYVVELDDRVELVPWSAAMGLASPRTTNNQAEYLGLMTGLAAADGHSWRPLSVVGDSQLIVHTTPTLSPAEEPSPPELLPLGSSHCRQPRRAHHLRVFNKSADAAANIAMDTHRSIRTHHPTARPDWAGLDQLSAGEFLHW